MCVFVGGLSSSHLVEPQGFESEANTKEPFGNGNGIDDDKRKVFLYAIVSYVYLERNRIIR